MYVSMYVWASIRYCFGYLGTLWVLCVNVQRYFDGAIHKFPSRHPTDWDHTKMSPASADEFLLLVGESTRIIWGLVICFWGGFGLSVGDYRL